MAGECTHLDSVMDAAPGADGCENCLAAGGTWLHLRMCRSCGHIGCCDDSPGKHATAHFQATSHPLIQSYEPGETWWWCYVDGVGFDLADVPSYSHS